MDVNPYQSPQAARYDPPPLEVTRRRPRTFLQQLEDWVATAFAAAIIIPIVVYLRTLLVSPGVTREIWWWVTLPSMGLVAVVVWLAASCLRELARTD